MKKFIEAIAGIFVICAGVLAIIKTGPTDLKVLGVICMVLIGITYFLASTFLKWEQELKQDSRGAIKALVTGSRATLFVAILLIIGMPKLYDYLPVWIKERAVTEISELSDEESVYNMEIKYVQLFPQKNNELFFVLRDTTKMSTTIGLECALGAEAKPVIMKVIGDYTWLRSTIMVLLGLSILFIFLTYPFKIIAPKMSDNNENGNSPKT